jgi:hypothetical protein
MLGGFFADCDDSGAAALEVWSRSAAAQASADVKQSLKEFICLFCVELCVHALLRKIIHRDFAQLLQSEYCLAWLVGQRHCARGFQVMPHHFGAPSRATLAQVVAVS